MLQISSSSLIYSVKESIRNEASSLNGATVTQEPTNGIIEEKLKILFFLNLSALPFTLVGTRDPEEKLENLGWDNILHGGILKC